MKNRFYILVLALCAMACNISSKDRHVEIGVQKMDTFKKQSQMF